MYHEVILVVFLRTVLFFYCRRFLLRTLYHGLRDLSNDLTLHDPQGSAETPQLIELGPLPLPNVQQRDSRNSAKTQLHSVLASTIFSACFSESTMLLLLLLFQAIGVLSPRTRLSNWSFSINALLILILLLVPLTLSYLVILNTSTGKRSPISRLLLCSATVSFYGLALSFVPLPAELQSQTLMDTALTRLIVIGTVCIGGLSGIGAINNAWTYLPFLLSRVPRHSVQSLETMLQNSQSSLSKVADDLSKRRDEARRKERHKISNQESKGWLSRLVPSFGSDDDIQELKGLEALHIQMTREVAAIQEKLSTAKASNTVRGRALNWAGSIFAIYGIIRILNSVANLLLPAPSGSTLTESTHYPDIIAQLVVTVVAHIAPAQVNPSIILNVSRQLGLVFIGLIMLSSLRLVLRAVTRVLQITSRNLGASLMLLMLAQLMGTYLLSTIVQLRTSFPPPPVDENQNLFAAVPAYQVFGFLLDSSLLLAAGLSAFMKWGTDKVNGFTL